MRLFELFARLDELTRRGFLKGVASVAATSMAGKVAGQEPEINNLGFDLDQKAIEAVNTIKKFPEYLRYEFIVLILEDGRLTRPHTDKHSDHVRVPTPNSGKKVVAMVHTHPLANQRGAMKKEEKFSQADILEATRLNVPTYVLGYDGILRMWKKGMSHRGQVIADLTS